VGYCDLVSATSAQGWAYHPAVPDKPLVMHVLVDGQYICSVTCDLVRQDVTAAGYSSRKAGFYVAIPPELQDGHDHMLEFRTPDGSPISLRDQFGPHLNWILPKAEFAPGAADQQDIILGNLDPVLEREVRGWAYAKADADVPFSLDIFIDNVFQFAVPCDVERVDVRTAGHPNAKVAEMRS